MKITFLGQCGFLIEGKQVTIAIDPVLNDIVENGTSFRAYPPVMTPEELTVNYIFCTHDHIDHLAVETVMGCLNTHNNTKVVIPRGCKKILASEGLLEDRMILLSDLEEKVLSDTLSVKGLSTAHPVHQLNEECEDCNLAYSIVLDGKRLVHLGDTYLTERLQKSLAELGQIDVFMTPINGRDEEREARGIIGNLSSKQAADLASSLECEFVIPTHFDMILGNTEDPQNFAKAYVGKYSIPELEKDIIVE